MIIRQVQPKDIEFAKKQIAAFEKIDAGSWRYSNVEAWRGIVCEMITSRWLEENFTVTKKAKGLDDSGKVDDCDLIIHDLKFEIKSATKNYFQFMMPKVHDLNDHPKDFYIGSKYDETTTPNQIKIIGFIERSEILKYPIEKNKGAPYYKFPLSKLINIEYLNF